MHPLTLATCVSAGTYVGTKWLSYAAAQRPNSYFPSVNGNLEAANKAVDDKCGRVWSVFKAVIYDNLWLTAFYLTFALNPATGVVAKLALPPLKLAATLIITSLELSALVYLVRQAVSVVFDLGNLFVSGGAAIVGLGIAYVGLGTGYVLGRVSDCFAPRDCNII